MTLVWMTLATGVGWGFAIPFFIGWLYDRRRAQRLDQRLTWACQTSAMYEAKLTEAWKKLYPASAHLL